MSEATREPLNRHAGYCPDTDDAGRRCVGALHHMGGHIYEGDEADPVAVAVIRGDTK